MRIDFDVVDLVLPEIDFDRMRRWIVAVADSYGFKVGRLFYRFCSDEEILSVNREFINHDYFTDIITFDYTVPGRLSGDIIISLDTVASNAALLAVEPTQELYRVIIHGVLHLCGINDKGPGERAIMEAAENRALLLLQTIP